MSSHPKGTRSTKDPTPMKTIILCLALISQVAAQKPAPLEKAQKPVLQKDRQVLIDYRVDDEATPVKIAPATQRMVLSKVFRKYLTDANRCNQQFSAGDAEDYLGAARKAGQMVPSIGDVET